MKEAIETLFRLLARMEEVQSDPVAVAVIAAEMIELLDRMGAVAMVAVAFMGEPCGNPLCRVHGGTEFPERN